MFSKLFIMGFAALSIVPAVVSVPVGLFGSDKMELAKDLHNFHARHTHHKSKGHHHVASKHQVNNKSLTLNVTSEASNYTSGPVVSGFVSATTEDDCDETKDAVVPAVQAPSNTTTAAPAPTSTDDEDCDDEEEEDDDASDDDCKDDAEDSTSTTAATVSASATVAAATLNPTTTSTTTTQTHSATAAATPYSAPMKTTPTTANVSTGTKYSGKATFYTQNGVAGACGKKHPDGALIGAMNKSMYEASTKNGVSSWCGKSVQITNTANGKKVTIVIADECPDCAHGSIDLSTGSFDKLGSRSTGVLPITWTLA